MNTLRQITDGSLDDIDFPSDFFQIKEEPIYDQKLSTNGKGIENCNDVVLKSEISEEYEIPDADDFDIEENHKVKLKSDIDTSSSSKLQAKNSCKKCGQSFKQIGLLKRHWKNCLDSDEEEIARDPRVLSPNMRPFSL